MAGKMTYYILFLTVTILLFHFGGLIDDTPSHVLLSVLTNPESLRNSSWYSTLAAAIALVGTAGVIIGSFFAQKTELIIKASTSTFLFLIGWDMIALFLVVSQTDLTFATLIISPLLFVYTFTVLEWWTGQD